MDATKSITYRVNIAYDTKQVTITSIGMESVDTTVKDNYNSVDEFPFGTVTRSVLCRIALRCCLCWRFRPRQTMWQV